jgi:hypothetical protein
MGHPMSEQAHLIMEFTRPDMGHMTFNWTLDDPKTYTPPSRTSVFVLSPQVELMEYGCMENNLRTLLDRAVTPWLEPNDDPSIVPAKWEWTSFDLAKPQKFTGVIKELKWERDVLATAKIDVAGKTYDAVLGPPVRLDSRGLDEVDVQPGKTLTFEAVAASRTRPRFACRRSRAAITRSICVDKCAGSDRLIGGRFRTKPTRRADVVDEDLEVRHIGIGSQNSRKSISSAPAQPAYDPPTA